MKMKMRMRMRMKIINEKQNNRIKQFHKKFMSNDQVKYF